MNSRRGFLKALFGIVTGLIVAPALSAKSKSVLSYKGVAVEYDPMVDAVDWYVTKTQSYIGHRMEITGFVRLRKGADRERVWAWLWNCVRPRDGYVRKGSSVTVDEWVSSSV